MILFEGEYLNGEKNGKGKEYNHHGDLLFEGEYLNGKEYNGKRYDPDGNMIYELKEGNGYVKLYDVDGQLRFEGEYKNGEKKWNN